VVPESALPAGCSLEPKRFGYEPFVPPPRVLALDINETVSDLSGLIPRLEEVGARGHLLQTFFASALRDGFALTAAGGYADFATVAQASLRSLLAAEPSVSRDPGDAAAHVLAGMAELSLHEDVRPGLERLDRAGIRLVALTNGSADTTRQLLERGGVASHVERCLSVEEVHRWKPAPEPYRMAAERCGVEAEEMMLVAVHPWDVHGAKRAGLRAAWINRDGASYPEHLIPPDLSCPGFDALADALA
jgi:2-haloacid dehalogenase